MQVIRGTRGSGKTKKLIQHCLDNNVTILCRNKAAESLIKEKSIAYFNQVVKTISLENLNESKDERLAIDEFDTFICDLLKHQYQYNGTIDTIVIGDVDNVR